MFISKDGIDVPTRQVRKVLPQEHYLIKDLVDLVKDFMCNQPVDKNHAFRLFNEAETLRNKWLANNGK
jgi:hypothetical protein